MLLRDIRERLGQKSRRCITYVREQSIYERETERLRRKSRQELEVLFKQEVLDFDISRYFTPDELDRLRAWIYGSRAEECGLTIVHIKRRNAKLLAEFANRWRKKVREVDGVQNLTTRELIEAIAYMRAIARVYPPYIPSRRRREYYHDRQRGRAYPSGWGPYP